MSKPERLCLETTDITSENIERIAALFPNCLTERKIESGKVVKAIDFDMLRQELSHDIVEGPQERYQFNWPEKRKVIRLANAPTDMTLRPCREESVDFDTTQNLYIEGDNLEVLKLLRENYLGKVKMIYIDPPYNTGKEFVYNDDFAEGSAEWKMLYERDAEGNKLSVNSESNGRFHTDWLNMMYPRLKVAKDLLSEDGVIFISIDDNEITNLESLCCELFGSSNKIATIVREAIKGGSRSKNIREVTDYVVCFAKNANYLNFGGVEGESLELNLEDEYGRYAKGRELNKWGAGSRREDSPSMFYPIPGPNGEEVYPIRNDGSEGRWRLGKTTMKALLDAHNAIFERRKDGTFIVYEKIRSAAPKVKQFTTLFINDYINAKGTEEIKVLFNLERTIFDYAKPSCLIKALCVLADADDSIILDFFSGSATTAHAVMKLNSEDGGNRKFIMVQLPEPCEEKSEAFKAGYKNICEIGKERIRRAGKKILEEVAAKNAEMAKKGSQGELELDNPVNPVNSVKTPDVGFRVLKLDTSNMEDVKRSPSQFAKEVMQGTFNLDGDASLANNIKPGRTGEDLLFQVMPRLDIPLSAKIATEEIGGKRVFVVDDGYLMASFDRNIDEATITDIARRKPVFFVMCDGGYANDNVADNFEQIWREFSPDTVRRVI